MSHKKTLRYEVRIAPRQSCAPDKSKYNADYEPNREIEAKNYFNTLMERYQAYALSKPEQTIKQATGQHYIITLSTILEDATQQQHSESSDSSGTTDHRN